MGASLSKTKYLAGLQCEKRLWLERHDPHRAAPRTEADERRLTEGREVGVLARDRFPGGVAIEAASIRDRIRRTAEAIARTPPAIYEGAFEWDGALVVVDILSRRPGGSWDLVEVKSSTSLKDEHRHDLAFQKHVLEQCGLRIAAALVAHLNPACAHPDFSNLFLVEDVTAEVVAAQEAVGARLARFGRVLETPSEPMVAIGDHCRSPRDCPFRARCWKDVGEFAIFRIPGLAPERKAELRERGVIHIRDLPIDLPLTDAQRAHVERTLAGRVQIDAAGIRKRLSELVYPLHFLDFETDGPAVPRFFGAHPYEQVPFQYSLHVMDEIGTVQHFDFLHVESTDPRPALIDSLLRHIGPRGSVIAWFAPFEEGVLRHVARVFSEHASALEAIASRLWDQMEIFPELYFHPGFEGSRSIKAVLPVLVPALRYDTLVVQRGTDAQLAWNEVIGMPPGEARERLVRALREYCRQDTLAMVEIHRVLSRL